MRHYTLADDDIEHIRARRLAHNQLGFALQLCAFRYPGRLLIAGETIPLEVAEFVAAQIGVKGIDLAGYAETDVTRLPRLKVRFPRQKGTTFPSRRLHLGQNQSPQNRSWHFSADAEIGDG